MPSSKIKKVYLLSALLLLSLVAACNRAGQMFGPKDEGGFYLVIAVKADSSELDQSIQQTIAVMQKRCEQMGIYCSAKRHGVGNSNQIMLRVSSPENPERIKSVLLSQGLELRAVVSPSNPSPVQTYPTEAEAKAEAGTDNDVLPYLERETGAGEPNTQKFVVVERTPIVTGQDIRDAKAANLTGGEKDYQINFRLTPAGAQKFGRWTGANIYRYMAVVLNKQVRSVAYIQGQIFDDAQITGRFTKEQAEDAALVLMSGNLPAPIEALEEGIYKP